MGAVTLAGLAQTGAGRTAGIEIFSAWLLVPALAALAGLLWVRRGPRGLGWSLFVFSITFLAVQHPLRHPPVTGSRLIHGAWVGAWLSAGWGMVSVVIAAAARRRREARGSIRDLRAVTGIAALATGAASTVALSILLCMRVVHASAELIHRPGSPLALAYDFPASGQYVLLVLLASSLLAWAGPARRLPASAPFWLMTGAAAWRALARLPAGALPGQERYDALACTLSLWGVSAALIVGATVMLEGLTDRRKRWVQALSHPQALIEPRPMRRGLHLSCGAVGVALLLTSALHLAILAAEQAPWRTLRWLLESLGLLAAGCALLTLVTRRWSIGLSEVGWALLSLGVAGGFALCVPTGPASAAERYPMVFNALQAGFAVVTGVWIWLAAVWDQQLRDGQAWTPAGRQISLARRFGFYCACLSLLAGSLMALWPRFPGVAAPDDTLGRFIAGIGANVLAVGVFAWCARKSRRMTFHLLCLLAVVSLLGFAASRMLPFAASGG